MIILQLHKKLQLALIVLIIIFALMSFASIVDITSDLEHHAPWHHIWVEIGIFSLSLTSVLILAFIIKKADKVSLPKIREELDEANSKGIKWQQENERLIKNLAMKIKSQFLDWGLTKAECEIGFLLLKGFSLKEIASLRNTSERTVREQAINIYSKSKLKNRSELTAFFLEDLLAPP